jgi:predicted ATPase
MTRGWALAEQGQPEAGMRQLQQGLTAWRATGTELICPYVLAILAEVYGKQAQAAAGLAMLAEACAAVERTAERWWEAELYRLKGELLRQSAGQAPPPAAWRPAPAPETPGGEAETCWQRALVIARRQQARILELRAAMSLGRLWQSQGRRADAYQLLSPVYGWFTEGFDTPDLREAQALLLALR